MDYKIIHHTQIWEDHIAHYFMESHGNGLVRLSMYNDGYSELSDLYVLEDSRGNGIATALVNDAIQCFKQSETNSKELKALLSEDNPDRDFISEFYKKLGFEHKGIEAPLNTYDEDKHQLKWYDVFVIKKPRD